ncbi:MAG: glycoside hydrolase family 3 protein [Treponema sp.]|nr:glycoside hydrolase family 3 protein [Treponema sp.]
MKKFFLSLSFIFTAVFIHAEEINFWSEIPDNELCPILISKMSDEELLSQILMFGWAGQEPSDLLNSWVTERGLGSVKVFGWNTDDTDKVAKSVRMLQKKAVSRPLKIPLFVATDQEGGWIRHVKGDTSDTPGNMAIGASGYPIDAYYSGYYINKEIKALGINMNFAPTVDIYTNLESTVIGPRSFGSDPKNVGILGEAFAKGSMAAGVIPTAKHFPGHGDTSLDSHGKLPEIDISRDLLESRELVPFIYLIKAGIPAIMSAHLSFPQLEPDGTPASLSKKFLSGILRKELGYKGLIITDDMQMNGATLFAGSYHHAVTMAIEAGNDIVISSKTANLNSSVWTVNLDLMKTDPDFKARVKDAASRVILAKLSYFKNKNHAPLYPDETKLSEFIPDQDGKKFFLEQACRSISFEKKGKLFPYKPQEEEKILICGPFNALFNEGKKRYPNAGTFYFSYTLKDDESNFDNWNAVGLEWTAKKYDTIIILVYDRHTADIARRLKNSGKQIIILSIMSPVFVLDSFDFADTILCGYSYSDYSFAALFGALNGEFTVRGTIPLDR